MHSMKARWTEKNWSVAKGKLVSKEHSKSTTTWLPLLAKFAAAKSKYRIAGKAHHFTSLRKRERRERVQQYRWLSCSAH